jgi:hypothetical protein
LIQRSEEARWRSFDGLIETRARQLQAEDAQEARMQEARRHTRTLLSSATRREQWAAHHDRLAAALEARAQEHRALAASLAGGGGHR